MNREPVIIAISPAVQESLLALRDDIGDTYSEVIEKLLKEMDLFIEVKE